jgi:hypothetical protein
LFSIIIVYNLEISWKPFSRREMNISNDDNNNDYNAHELNCIFWKCIDIGKGKIQACKLFQIPCFVFQCGLSLSWYRTWSMLISNVVFFDIGLSLCWCIGSIRHSLCWYRTKFKLISKWVYDDIKLCLCWY